MAWVYFLKNNSGTIYIGSTSDIERRMRQHLAGHTPSTRRLKTDTLAFSQEYKTLQEAREIERRLKKLKRKDYLEKIITDGAIRMKPKSSAPTPGGARVGVPTSDKMKDVGASGLVRAKDS